MKIAIIILAAGNSSRLGKPKQMLNIDGQALLVKTIKITLDTKIQDIYVVSGAYRSEIQEIIKPLPVTEIYNPNWHEGMSSSIKAAINALDLSIDACLFCVCDQPYLSVNILNEFIQKGKNITASAYENTLGVPVFFERKYFEDLKKLSGQQGAKYLLKQYSDDVKTIDFPLGHIDIDTEEDYKKLIL